MPFEIDEERLREHNEEISRVMTSEAFLNQLRAVADAPEEERLSAAIEHLTPEALEAAGVELPEGGRISSRYFEGTDVPEMELAELRGQPNLLRELHSINPETVDELRGKPAILNEFARRLESPIDEDFIRVCGNVGVPIGLVVVCATVGDEFEGANVHH